MLYRNQIDSLLTGEGFVLEASATPEPTILVREDAFPSETTRRRKSTGADDLSMFFRGALIQKKRLLQDIVQELSDGQRNLGCSASRGSNC